MVLHRINGMHALVSAAQVVLVVLVLCVQDRQLLRERRLNLLNQLLQVLRAYALSVGRADGPLTPRGTCHQFCQYVQMQTQILNKQLTGKDLLIKNEFFTTTNEGNGRAQYLIYIYHFTWRRPNRVSGARHVN